MDEMISVIVPIYNAEKYLDNCIDSIVTQSYQNIELILVNDGSTDQSDAKCKRWMQKDDRIKYYQQTNSGVSVARNLGLKNANGRYVTFVDADDSIIPFFCEKMKEIMSGGNYDIVFCEHNSFYENGGHNYSGDAAGKTLEISIDEFEYNAQKSRREVWGAIFKLELVRNIAFPIDIAVGEDALFVARAIKKSKMIAYYDAPMYNYRIQSESAYFGKYTSAKGTEIDAWIQISDVFDEGTLSKISADAMCAETAITMLGRYAGDANFKRECVSRLIDVYQRKKSMLLQYDRIKNRSAIKHILYGLFPHIFVMYWGWKNGKKHRDCDTL